MFFKLVKGATQKTIKDAKDNVIKLRKELRVEEGKLKKIEEGPFKGTSGKKKQAANKKVKIKTIKSDLNKQLGEIRKVTPKPKGKATQKGLRFKKKPEIQEGAALDAETGRSVSAARDVESGRAGRVTRGKFSVTNFIKDQIAMSPGMQSRRETNNAFQRAINKAETQAEKDKLRDALEKIRARREKFDARAETKRKSNISQGVRASNRKPKEVDHYGIAIKEAREDGIFESEHTKKLTPPQRAQVEKAARSSGKSKSERIGDAITEEKNIQAGRTKPGETSVGARKGGERGQRVRGEEAQLQGMISGTRRNGVTKLRPENEDTLRRRTRRNKGGMVKKKAIGATDYRMNKGGLLLSSVDNRKKR